MSKLYNVQSKYKNPDKFVEKLKGNINSFKVLSKSQLRIITGLREMLESCERKAYGKFWYKYERAKTINATFDSKLLLKNKQILAEVWLKGEIIQLQIDPQNGNMHTTINIESVYYKGPEENET